MGIFDDVMADLEEQRRQQYAEAFKKESAAVAGGKKSYDKDKLTSLAKTGGVYTPPPTAMPLPPDMTRQADRQSMSRRRRRGRASTMLTSALGEEITTLGG